MSPKRTTQEVCSCSLSQLHVFAELALIFIAYLASLVHPSAICDRCMTCIEGEWFRCAYCARDLCDSCEGVDTHDDTHVFLVLKAPVSICRLSPFASLVTPLPSCVG